MTSNESIERIVKKAATEIVGMERSKLALARKRADDWKARATEYRATALRYQKELAEARSLLRKDTT